MKHFINKPVVFFGSGPVAAQSLALLAQDFEIEAVITKPKPEHHKGDFPVITLAQSLGLNIIYVKDKKELSAAFAAKPVKSRLGIIIDFGIIVSQDVIDYFPLGIVNSHFSILPQWRGADPITFAILSGQKQTGVSIMLLVEALDEGPLLAQAPYKLRDDITAPELTKDLIALSHQALREVIPLYVDGKALPAPQEEVTMADTKTPTFSRKLTKDDGIIDWKKPAKQIEREIRAFIDWPKSRTNIAGKEVIIIKSRVQSPESVAGNQPLLKPGRAFITETKQLAVQTGKGTLIIDKLKPAGKNEMTSQAFLAGYGQYL